jgi:hypothetical protein
MFDLETINEAIAEATEDAQALLLRDMGELYTLEDLKTVYTKWFAASIEAILEEMPRATGSNPHAFNTTAFTRALSQIQPRAQTMVTECSRSIAA